MLTEDEFIFCLLCAEDQDVWIDEEELRRNLLQWVQLSWNDVIQLKNRIVTKLWDKKVEFIIPTKWSILLREKLGDDGINKSTKLVEYLRKNRRVLISQEDLLRATWCETVNALLITMWHVRWSDKALIIQVWVGDDFKWIFFGTEAEFDKFKAQQANNTDSLWTDVEILAKRWQINKLWFEYRWYLFQEWKALRKIYDALFLSENWRIKSQKDISEHIKKINEHFAKNNVEQRIEVYWNPEENRYILASIKVSNTEKKETSREIEDCNSLFSPTSLEFTWYSYLFRNKWMQTSILTQHAWINRPLSKFIDKINDTLNTHWRNQRVRIIKQRFAILEFYENSGGDDGGAWSWLGSLKTLAGVGWTTDAWTDGRPDSLSESLDGDEWNETSTWKPAPKTKMAEISQEDFSLFSEHILDLGHDFSDGFTNFGIWFEGTTLNFWQQKNWGSWTVELTDIEFLVYSFFLQNAWNAKSTQWVMNEICLFEDENPERNNKFFQFLSRIQESIWRKIKSQWIKVKDLLILNTDQGFMIPSCITRVEKWGVIFLWNERTGEVSYKEGRFNINDLDWDAKIISNISRLFSNDNDTLELKVNWNNKNTNDRRNDIDNFFKDQWLPFWCRKVSGRNIEFWVKIWK